MPAGFFDSSILANHDHSNTPGDGGQLSNISISGTVAASGDMTAANFHATAGIVDEVSNATLPNQVPRMDQVTVWTLLNGS